MKVNCKDFSPMKEHASCIYSGFFLNLSVYKFLQSNPGQTKTKR